MWKRLPRVGRGKETNISTPTLIETTYDEKTLQQIPNVSDIQHSYPSLRRKGTDENLSTLPPLEFGRPAPSQPSAAMHNRDVSEASVYSQPPLDPRYDWSRDTRPVASSIYPDVSPPNSPGLYANTGAQYGDDGDVSPVEDEPQSLTPTQTPTSAIRSQLPIPRKVTPGSQAAFNKMRKTSGPQPTRWDKYSGEPTTKPSGQPGQVKPGGGPAIPLKPSTIWISQPPRQNDTTSEDAPRATPITDRSSRFANTGLFIDTRPPWRGASGRHAIVEPVADKPGQAIPIPRRSSKNVASPATTPSNATPSGFRRVPAESETTPVSKSHSPGTDVEAIRPPVPLKISINTPSKSHASPPSPTFRPSGYPSPISPGNEVTRGQSHMATDSSPQGSTTRRAAPRKSIDTTNSTQSSREHPNSRFSWTTYNTDTTYQHSPPPSPPPPIPKMASADSRSIMNRTRPVPSGSNFPPPAPSSKMSTIRKPVASPIFEQPRHSPPPSVAPSTNTKALPRTPQESSASDLIESLNAQLDDLSTQRGNIQKVIRGILETQPQNPLVSDLKARKEADKKLQGLKDDLAEITSQEHEVGLRLHRAYKKRERIEGAAPTALWIKRITS